MQATPSPIQCQPLVSQAIYDDYVKSAEEAAEKLKLGELLYVGLLSQCIREGEA